MNMNTHDSIWDAVEQPAQNKLFWAISKTPLSETLQLQSG